MPEKSTDKAAPASETAKAAGPKQGGSKAGGAKPDAAKQSGGKQGAAKQPAAAHDAAHHEASETDASPQHAPKEKPRLQQFYRNEVVAQLKNELKLANPMQVPRISKITVNMGVGEALADRKIIDAAAGDLAKISGQKPKICRARRAVASFKVREGIPIGCMVTLRGARMYEFLDRLINIAMPRIRDFRGLSPRGFDGRGNYSFGVREQIIFPEIQYDAIDQLRGMDITITTTARDNKQGRALLEAFRFPFRR
jgi:large subunit ribosomal protein L5